VLQALLACPHLQEVTIWSEYASADAMKNLLQLGLEMDQWLTVADEIRRGRCNVQTLPFAMLLQGAESDATEAAKAIASAIQMDCNLEHLMLEVGEGFADDGMKDAWPWQRP
jgi:hypothetical protein